MRRRRLPLAPLGLFLLLFLSSSVAAATPQPSVYLVLPQTPTRSITVGGAVTLPVISRTDGGGKTASGGTISYSTTATNETISVSIDSNTDAGVTLSLIASNISCTSPCTGAGGSATGYQTLSTGSVSIITGIGAISGGSATADLTYKVTTSSAPVGEVTKTVTITIGA